jgi:hypothetical protein
MPNLAELIGKLDEDAHALAKLAQSIREEYHFPNSSSADPPTSSPTASAASGGDTSARAITGPTEDWWGVFSMKMLLLAKSSQLATMTNQEFVDMMDRARHSTDSFLCVTGGSESQPRHSDAPPGSARGESCDPTSPPAPCVHIPMQTLRGWSEQVRTAVAHLCTLRAKYGPTMTLQMLESHKDCLAMMQRLEARLRTLT